MENIFQKFKGISIIVIGLILFSTILFFEQTSDDWIISVVVGIIIFMGISEFFDKKINS